MVFTMLKKSPTVARLVEKEQIATTDLVFTAQTNNNVAIKQAVKKIGKGSSDPCLPGLNSKRDNEAS